MGNVDVLERFKREAACRLPESRRLSRWLDGILGEVCTVARLNGMVIRETRFDWWRLCVEVYGSGRVACLFPPGSVWEEDYPIAGRVFGGVVSRGFAGGVRWVVDEPLVGFDGGFGRVLETRSVLDEARGGGGRPVADVMYGVFMEGMRRADKHGEGVLEGAWGEFHRVTSGKGCFWLCHGNMREGSVLVGPDGGLVLAGGLPCWGPREFDAAFWVLASGNVDLLDTYVGLVEAVGLDATRFRRLVGVLGILFAGVGGVPESNQPPHQ